MAKRVNFRTDSTLGNLPTDRQEQIAEFLSAVETGDRYEATRQHLAEDGIKVSRSSVVRWFTSWRLQRDISEADSLASDVQTTLKEMNIGLTAEQLEEAGQIVFVKKAMQ